MHDHFKPFERRLHIVEGAHIPFPIDMDAKSVLIFARALFHIASCQNGLHIDSHLFVELCADCSDIDAGDQQIQLMGGGHLAPELVNVSTNSVAADLLQEEVVRREAKGQAPCDFFREILNDGLEPYALTEFEAALGALMDEYECGVKK